MRGDRGCPPARIVHGALGRAPRRAPRPCRHGAGLRSAAHVARSMTRPLVGARPRRRHFHGCCTTGHTLKHERLLRTRRPLTGRRKARACARSAVAPTKARKCAPAPRARAATSRRTHGRRLRLHGSAVAISSRQAAGSIAITAGETAASGARWLYAHAAAASAASAAAGGIQRRARAAPAGSEAGTDRAECSKCPGRAIPQLS